MLSARTNASATEVITVAQTTRIAIVADASASARSCSACCVFRSQAARGSRDLLELRAADADEDSLRFAGQAFFGHCDRAILLAAVVLPLAGKVVPEIVVLPRRQEGDVLLGV
jgi:hypothetical protein